MSRAAGNSEHDVNNVRYDNIGRLLKNPLTFFDGLFLRGLRPWGILNCAYRRSISIVSLPPASSLCCGCALRSSRGTREARLPRLVSSRLEALYYPSGLAPLRFMAPPKWYVFLLAACGSSCPDRVAVPLRAVYIGGFVFSFVLAWKMGDYSSPIIKFSMYRDLFLNSWSFCQASRLRRIVTALWRLVEGRPAPSLRPPRLDFLHIIYWVNYKWFISLSQYLPVSPCLRIGLKGLAVCAAITLHVKFYFVLHLKFLHFKDMHHILCILL